MPLISDLELYDGPSLGLLIAKPRSLHSQGATSLQPQQHPILPHRPKPERAHVKHMPFSSPRSIPALLKSCKTILHLHHLHAHVIRKGLEQDHFIVSHLLSLSAHSLPYSLSIFHRVVSPSTFLCNILLKNFSKSASHSRDAVSLFLRMKRTDHAVPDEYTYTSLIKSCSNDGRRREGESVHGSAIRCGLYGELFVGSSLVDFYGKLREVVSARKVFDELTERNVVSWTSMVVSYANVGDLDNAMRIFEKMPKSNLVTWNAIISGLVKAGNLIGARKVFDKLTERDVVSFTTMIDGYAKAGDMESARVLFEEAPERDIVMWTALINGYAQNGQPDEAVEIFRRMESVGVEPDKHLLVSLTSACAKVGSLELAKWVDSYFSRSSIDITQPYVVAALIDMNAKCGNMDKAQRLFDEMPQRNMIVYCSMIQGHSINGRADLAVSLFDRMLNEGFIPDEVAFKAILTACAQGGLVEEGWCYFETLRDKYSIVPTPDHYWCVVDLLGRAGRLKAAYELLKSMPVEPNACAWGALLGACKLHGNIELGEVVANRLSKLEPQNADSYVLLSNIYAASDRWLDVSLLRDMIKERGLKNVPACSLT